MTKVILALTTPSFRLWDVKNVRIIMCNLFDHQKQEVSLKKIIVEGYRAVAFLNDSFQPLDRSNVFLGIKP